MYEFLGVLADTAGTALGVLIDPLIYALPALAVFGLKRPWLIVPGAIAYAALAVVLQFQSAGALDAIDARAAIARIIMGALAGWAMLAVYRVRQKRKTAEPKDPAASPLS